MTRPRYVVEHPGHAVTVEYLYRELLRLEATLQALDTDLTNTESALEERRWPHPYRGRAIAKGLIPTVAVP